jgi:hypothetical protein
MCRQFRKSENLHTIQFNCGLILWRKNLEREPPMPRRYSTQNVATIDLQITVSQPLEKY